MALDFENSVSNMSDLNLWYKLQSNEQLTLADVPEIIRLRWLYFKDNWEFIKPKYEDKIKTYQEADRLKTHIDLFSDFVASQRTSTSKRNPFDNSNIIFKYYTIFDTTIINNINLTFEERQTVDNKVRVINNFTRGDFLRIRASLEEERDNLADKAKATDEDYNRVFQRSPQVGRVNLGNKDVNKMYELQESIKAVNFILANSFSLETSAVDPFALARQNANNSEIDIGTYASGNLVRLDYGEDLQALALRTLGNADKWIDIAIANGLKPPYIDEIGEKIDLISNASGNQINIAGLDTNSNLNVDKLSVGQVMLLQSDVETFPEQRNILSITEVPVSGELIIQLEGEANLDRYKLSESAHIRIYKQSTTNSSFFILIPSEDQLDDDSKGGIPWFLTSSGVTEKRQKVDLYLGADGDLDFNPTGDLQLSYGLENAVQAVKLKLITEAGELRRHPDYGLIQLQGNGNNNIDDIKRQLTDSIVKNIAGDQRFSRINRLDVGYSNTLEQDTATSLDVILEVVLAGSGQLVPITFSVNT